MHQLDLLMNDYVSPIRTSGVLSEDTFRRIFSGVSTVHGVAHKFLEELEGLVERSTRSGGHLSDIRVVYDLSDLFVRFGPSWKLFVDFITGYRDGSRTLQEEAVRNERLTDLITGIKRDLKGRGENLHDLGGLLITPVQRVPRYKMLLDTLMKNTYEPRVCSHLERAVVIIEAVAQYCNTKELEKTLQTRLIEINRSLHDGGLVLPGRMLIREIDGVRHKISMIKVANGKIVGKERQCFSLLLLNDALCIIVPSTTHLGSRRTKVYQLPLSRITEVQRLSDVNLWKNASLQRLTKCDRQGFVVDGCRQGVEEQPRSYAIFTPDEKTSEEWITSIRKQRELRMSSNLIL